VIRRHAGYRDIAQLEERFPSAFRVGTSKQRVLEQLRAAGIEYEDRKEWEFRRDDPEVTIFIRWWTGFVFRTDLYLGLDFDQRGALLTKRPWTQSGF
jgi:hypothetical protein